MRPLKVTEVTRTKDLVQPYESPRGGLVQSYVEKAQGNPLRDSSERAQSCHIDLRIHGEPEKSPDNENQEKTSLIKLLAKQVLESPNKNQMMAELFTKSDEKAHQEISEDFKNIAKEQGNIEAHELFMITDALQCWKCSNCETSGHTFCTCGQTSRSKWRSKGTSFQKTS